MHLEQKLLLTLFCMLLVVGGLSSCLLLHEISAPPCMAPARKPNCLPLHWKASMCAPCSGKTH
jgi:hypothetical protein